MSETTHENDELTGPVDGCDACEGHTLKVDGLCLRHYVALRHELGEVEDAKDDLRNMGEVPA